MVAIENIQPDVYIIAICGEVTIRKDVDMADREWLAFISRAKKNGYTLPKQAIVDRILRAILENGITENDEPLLTLIMPCGSKTEYQTFDDIPDKDTPCPCGDPTHWLTKYYLIDERN